LPLPLVPAVMVIQDAVVDAVQLQLPGRLTPTVPVPLFASTERADAVSVTSHATALCATVMVCPPTATVPLRDEPGLAATVMFTVPAPFPGDPLDTAIQSDWLVAVQVHPACASTCTANAPPADATEELVGDTVYWHGAGSCAIAICASLTVTVPRRAAGSGFGATRNPTEPAPCPVVPEVIAIHEAALDADHVQSRFVSTAIVPLPPVAGADPIELVAATVHFDPVGAVTETDVDPQRAARTARTPTAHNSRARIAVEHGASALPEIRDFHVCSTICAAGIQPSAASTESRENGNRIGDVATSAIPAPARGADGDSPPPTFSPRVTVCC